MTILAVVVYANNGANEPNMLSGTYSLGDFSFWTRSTVKEFANFGCRTIAARTSVGQRQSVLQPQNDAIEEEYVCHCYVRSDRLTATAICPRSYNFRVAFSLLEKVMEAFAEEYPQWSTIELDCDLPSNQIPAILEQYQKPEEVDKISKIQSELDETKETMLKVIDQVLERGDKLEDLMARSNDLSATSRTFAKKSKQLNSCCVIL